MICSCALQVEVQAPQGSFPAPAAFSFAGESDQGGTDTAWRAFFQFKRTPTPGKPPPSLAEGEIALGIGDDPPRLLVGTATGVREFTFAAELAELRARIEALEAAWRRGDLPESYKRKP